MSFNASAARARREERRLRLIALLEKLKRKLGECHACRGTGCSALDEIGPTMLPERCSRCAGTGRAT